MRSHIETIPDGTYTFEEHIDSDGVDWQPLTIDLEMEVKGSGVHLDFSKSSPPCRGPLNSVLRMPDPMVPTLGKLRTSAA